MKPTKWKTLFSIKLIIASIIIYILHYLIFKDSHHIFIFLLEDIAFIPLEVLFVSLVIHKFMDNKEKELILEKLYILIGVFFNEVGNQVIKEITPAVNSKNNVCNSFFDDKILNEDVTDKEFNKYINTIKNTETDIQIKNIDIKKLANFLEEKRSFLINILQNPMLLEHDAFTTLIRYLFYLGDQLSHHLNCDCLEEDDLKIVKKEIEKLYPLLLYEWYNYIKHLKADNEYVFSIVLKNNPFNCS
jgi:hypothetical protein